MNTRLVRGSLINELFVAARYAKEVADAELRAEGVDPDEYGPLSFIGVMQPVTRTRLAEATGLRRTTQRDMIRRLIDRGHVREVPNPRDGRSTLLELTPAGQEIFDRGKPAFHRALRRFDGALDGRGAEHEEVVWRIRVAMQSLVGASEPDEVERRGPPW